MTFIFRYMVVWQGVVDDYHYNSLPRSIHFPTATADTMCDMASINRKPAAYVVLCVNFNII